MIVVNQGDEISHRVDRGACESDRVFFCQHPQRNFRVRPAWSDEIEDFARRGAIERTLPDGLCWWICVHQLIRDKVRMRWPLAAPHDFYPDPPEKIAREVWSRRVPREVRAIEKRLRRDLIPYAAVDDIGDRT
jgi:hypothetical protein